MDDTTRLRAAAQLLVDKLDECRPHIADAFVHRALRCEPYRGPDYITELEALREVLSHD